jgi:Family of unknown function (DUF6317)
MSDGFQVVMSDLLAAAETFTAEGNTFVSIMPGSCPALPDGGSAGFDGSLRAVVEAICLLHLQIGGDIEDSGGKLQTAHSNYQHTEESLTKLADQISDPSKIG